MKSDEVLNKIKVALGMETEEPKKVEMATAVLDNGTTVEAEAFEAGQPISVVVDGEAVPLPAGEYVMEDGMMLIISEDGIIGEIKEPETEEAEMEAEAPISRSEFDELKSAVKAIAESINASKQEKEELKPEVKEVDVEAEKVEMAEEPKAVKHSPEKSIETKETRLSSEGSTKKARITNFLINTIKK
jgi:predicted RNA-binding protein